MRLRQRWYWRADGGGGRRTEAVELCSGEEAHNEEDYEMEEQRRWTSSFLLSEYWIPDALFEEGDQSLPESETKQNVNKKYRTNRQIYPELKSWLVLTVALVFELLKGFYRIHTCAISLVIGPCPVPPSRGGARHRPFTGRLSLIMARWARCFSFFLCSNLIRRRLETRRLIIYLVHNKYIKHDY